MSVVKSLTGGSQITQERHVSQKKTKVNYQAINCSNKRNDPESSGKLLSVNGLYLCLRDNRPNDCKLQNKYRE